MGGLPAREFQRTARSSGLGPCNYKGPVLSMGSKCPGTFFGGTQSRQALNGENLARLSYFYNNWIYKNLNVE